MPVQGCRGFDRPLPGAGRGYLRKPGRAYLWGGESDGRRGLSPGCPESCGVRSCRHFSIATLVSPDRAIAGVTHQNLVRRLLFLSGQRWLARRWPSPAGKQRRRVQTNVADASDGFGSAIVLELI